MASESQQHDKGESQPSENTFFPSGRHKRPPPMSYPPTLGYAPPPPHSAYRPPGYYPYARAPPPAYYVNSTVHQQGCQKSSSFLQGILSTIIFLVMFIFTLQLIMLLALRPELPVFHVEDFSVLNFNATMPTFTAIWEAYVSVKNPNTRLKIDFGQIHSHMYYDKDYILASANSPKFSMETKTRNVIHARLSANNTDNSVESRVVDKLAKERSNGAVSFHFRMVFSTSSRSGSWFRSNPRSMEVVCEDIKIAFAGASGDGNIAASADRDCLVLS